MIYFSSWRYIDCLKSERCLVERKENDQVRRFPNCSNFEIGEAEKIDSEMRIE